MIDKTRIIKLKITAAKSRRNVLRMIKASGHGHVGGALSAIDIVTALYFDKMNIDPSDPGKPDRDRFLLSAGHKCLAQYSVMAERGYMDSGVLDTYGSFKACIPGHPDMHKLPGVEANTGALGHGISIAAGMAMSAKLDKEEFCVYAVTGDGELPEGSNWEAAAAAGKFGLDNLVVFVDNNGLQISGKVTDVMNMEDIQEKFRAFGWAVTEIDGNDMEQIVEVLDGLPLEKGKPNMILCHTVKAKGLSIGEGKAEYHFWNADLKELAAADRELEEQIGKLKKELEA
ncbi:transketolase [Lachnospiraceae bacterium 50-23]|jgi:transketolase|nr:transketolase [Dorea sp.]